MIFYHLLHQLQALPSLFRTLQQLTNLTFAMNNFDKVSESICELSSLEYLDFSNSQISELPAIIGALKKLEWLFLSDNQLSDFPVSFYDIKQLRYLKFCDNKFTQFPMNLIKLSALIHISAANNPAWLIEGELRSKLTKKGVKNYDKNNKKGSITVRIGVYPSITSNNKLIRSG